MTREELDHLERRLLFSGPVREAALTLDAIRPLIREVRESWAARDLAMTEAMKARAEVRRLRSERDSAFRERDEATLVLRDIREAIRHEAFTFEMPADPDGEETTTFCLICGNDPCDEDCERGRIMRALASRGDEGRQG